MSFPAINFSYGKETANTTATSLPFGSLELFAHQIEVE